MACRTCRDSGDLQDATAGSECGLAPEGRACHAYNEEAFHYFLALERKRAERSHRSLVLVLASIVRRVPGVRLMDSSAAHKLFTGLWLSTRDTDFIGWYRAGRVAGAVLTQPSTPPPENVCDRIRARVPSMLAGALPKGTRSMLRVHVLQLTAKVPRP